LTASKSIRSDLAPVAEETYLCFGEQFDFPDDSVAAAPSALTA
jgi:hypothetical protein